METPVAIIFDWDNTLIDSWSLLLSAVNHSLAVMGRYGVDINELKQLSYLPSQDVFQNMFGDDWEKARDICHDFFKSRHLSVIQPLSGAEDLLNFLQKNNISMAIVSNKNKEILSAEVDFLGWQDFFHCVIGSQDADFDKPHPAPALMACQKLQIEPKNVYFVGDSPTDWDCAKAVGAKAIAVGADYREEYQVLQFCPDLLKLKDFFITIF